MMRNKNKIYFDYAGATPIDKRVSKEMSFYESFFANPSAIYEDAVNIKNIIEEKRQEIAKNINVHNDEIVFTGSGTESNALALLGLINNYELKIKNENLKKQIPHIITSQIEHPAVLENCKMLEHKGQAEVTYLSVDEEGIINLNELKDSLKENTVLVSIMYANNEIGTIQPIEEIAKIIRRFKKARQEAPQGLASRTVLEGALLRTVLARPFTAFPVFHTDACQAMNYLFTENIEKLGVDMMSFNSSKIYGPKGIGVLYKKRLVDISPLYYGGGQEFGLRSGTENISLIVGFAEALRITNSLKEKENNRLTEIRDYGISKLLSLSEISGFKIILNGHCVKRLPNNINITITGISSELLVIELSALGIFVSEKSACKSNDYNKSYVIKAIRKFCLRTNKEQGSLRISLGRMTKKKDMDMLYKSLKKILEKYNKIKIGDYKK
jgi:cysteine desulfurase